MKLLGKLLGKHESSLPFVVVKISKLFLISLSADSNLFFAELMLRYPSETFFGSSLRNSVQIGNDLLHEY